MAKRRKRTNSNVPAKGRLRDIADDLWSRAVRDDWNNRCAVCGKKATDPHHLIPRANYATRFELVNGIALCSFDHLWNTELAPHMNASGWLRWLAENYPERYKWYVADSNPEFLGTKNAEFFIGQILRLREYVDEADFTRIVGVRFETWLDEQRA